MNHTERIVEALNQILEPTVREHLRKMEHLEQIRETLGKDESIYCPWLIWK